MTYMPMFEMWRRHEDGALYDIVLDLGWGEDYPLEDLPWFFSVRIPLVRKRENGLPDAEESARLDQVENRVREFVRNRNGLYVGRRTGAGNRDLVFYMPERPRGLDERIRASVGTDLRFIDRDDRGWKAYESLLPSVREWRQIEDLKTIRALENADADPAKEHRVEHTVRVPGPKAAQAVLRMFDKLELEDASTHGEAPEIRCVGVQRTRLELESVHRMSWRLQLNVPKAKGAYEGWTADPEFIEEPEEDAEAESGGGNDDLEAILEALASGDGE